MTQTDDARGRAILQALKPDGWPETVHVGRAVIRFPNGVESGSWYSRPDDGDKTMPFARADLATQPDPLADPRVTALRDENEALRSLMSDLIQGARRDRSILIQRLGPLHVIETRVTKGQVLEAMRLTRKDQPHD